MDLIKFQFDGQQVTPVIINSEPWFFAKDIADNGLIEPIWLYGDKIIDGRNRYKACLETDTPPQFRQWSGEGSLVAFVVSLNLNRRHLTNSQRAMIALDMLPLLATEAKERQKAAGGDHGNQYTGGKMAVTAKMQEVPKGEAAQQAADIVGVSARMIYSAKKVAAESPENAEAIKAGTMSVDKAYNELKEKTKPQIHESALKPVCTEALQFSTIAISQLSRIRANDPKRIEAFNEVKEYIEKELKK